MIWKKKKLISPGNSITQATSVADVPKEKDKQYQLSEPIVSFNPAEETGVPASAIANGDTLKRFLTPFSDGSEKGTFLVPLGYKIAGDLVLDGKILVCGEISSGRLVAREVEIAASGTVAAPTEVAKASIFGKVLNCLTASESIVIGSAGVVYGDITTPDLVVNRGAKVSGSITPTQTS